MEHGQQRTVLYGRDLQSFLGPGNECRRRAAIRSCSEARRQLVRSPGLLRCLARQQEISSRPGCTTGQPIRHRGHELYGGIEEITTRKPVTFVTSSDLRLLIGSLCPVLTFSLARLGIRRGRRVLALEVCAFSRGGSYWKQVRRFNVRFMARSSSWRVARCSASWPWSNAWQGTLRLS